MDGFGVYHLGQNAWVERNHSSDLYLSSFKVRSAYHVTVPQEELATYPHQIQVAVVPMTEARRTIYFSWLPRSFVIAAQASFTELPSSRVELLKMASPSD